MPRSAGVAARRVIPLAALADAVRWTCHPAEAAERLPVHRVTLRTRLLMLTEAERVVVLDAAPGEHAA